MEVSFDQHVFWFQISVDIAFLVQILEPLDDIVDCYSCLGFCLDVLSVAEEVGDVVMGHHDRKVVSVDERSDHLSDVRMVHEDQDFHLVQEPLDVSLANLAERNDFEHVRPLGDFVPYQKDLPMSSIPQRTSKLK
jgi:hypothetical protein